MQHLKLVRNKGPAGQIAGQIVQSQNEQHEMIKVSKEVVELKICQLQKSINLEYVTEIDLIDGYISKMEILMYEYIDLMGKFRVVFRDDYDEIYKEEFSTNLNAVSDNLDKASKLRKQLKDLRNVKSTLKKLAPTLDTDYRLKI